MRATVLYTASPVGRDVYRVADPRKPVKSCDVCGMAVRVRSGRRRPKTSFCEDCRESHPDLIRKYRYGQDALSVATDDELLETA